MGSNVVGNIVVLFISKKTLVLQPLT